MEHERIGVCIIVLDKENRVLLGKRINSYKSGMLGMPGGRLEFDEPLEECGKRELLEETSLHAKNLHYVGVVRELQEGYNYIHFVFSCREYTGFPQTIEPEKCEGWEWYPLDSLPDNVVPGHRAALELYLTSSITVKELLAVE